jgi:hypothetical protein
LEARWARFFDELKIEWDYEPEGFDLGEAGYYLPDFYLPNLSIPTWVEIKPNDKLSQQDFLKVSTFRKSVIYKPENEARLVVLCGSPYLEKYTIKTPTTPDDWKTSGHQWISSQEVFGRCPLCGRIDIINGNCEESYENDDMYCVWCDIIDRNDGENADAWFHKGSIMLKTGYQIYRHPSIINAYNKAMSARFEHGESG